MFVHKLTTNIGLFKTLTRMKNQNLALKQMKNRGLLVPRRTVKFATMVYVAGCE